MSPVKKKPILKPILVEEMRDITDLVLTDVLNIVNVMVREHAHQVDGVQVTVDVMLSSSQIPTMSVEKMRDLTDLELTDALNMVNVTVREHAHQMDGVQVTVDVM